LIADAEGNAAIISSIEANSIAIETLLIFIFSCSPFYFSNMHISPFPIKRFLEHSSMEKPWKKHG
jgi:hypothetical protein